LAIYDARLFKPADKQAPAPTIVETTDGASSAVEARRTDETVN
jgi:hypothetical protein